MIAKNTLREHIAKYGQDTLLKKKGKEDAVIKAIVTPLNMRTLYQNRIQATKLGLKAEDKYYSYISAPKEETPVPEENDVIEANGKRYEVACKEDIYLSAGVFYIWAAIREVL